MRAAGRYAPSPSGALHKGSLLAAVASYLQARAQGARWLLRIDDLDTPRVVAGADRAILEALRSFGLRWDGPVFYQSVRQAEYAQAVAQLKNAGMAFDCGCTRREARSGPAGLEGPVYPGICRDGLPAGRAPRSVRACVLDERIHFFDGVQGDHAQNLAHDIGDFVIRRADGITAYQLATVLDDAAQGVSDVVRGADLLSSTPRQIYLQRLLGLSSCCYAHVPVLVDERGEKLGKSTGALPLDDQARGAQLWEILVLLGQQPEDSLHDASARRVMNWATDNWDLARVPRVAKLKRYQCRTALRQNSTA